MARGVKRKEQGCPGTAKPPLPLTSQANHNAFVSLQNDRVSEGERGRCGLGTGTSGSRQRMVNGTSSGRN